MTPDINIKDYYLKFIHNAKVDKYRYEKELKVIKELKEKLEHYLEENKQQIADEFGLSIYDVIYDYNKVAKYIDRFTKDNIGNRVIILQINKYGKYLEAEDKLNKQIKLVDKRKDLKFRQFQGIVNKYYMKVHQCLLEGMGYKYGYGIGTYCINYWKLDPSAEKKKVLDFAATRAKKKELLAKGVKLFDENEAAWYKARKIPYDGVDYRVFTNNTHYYEFGFRDSRISITTPYNYERTEYVYAKYKKLSQQEIADTYCKTIEDIYTMQLDIKYKLNILLIKDPSKYLNFVRNVNQTRYKHRAYNSENRQ